MLGLLNELYQPATASCSEFVVEWDLRFGCLLGLFSGAFLHFVVGLVRHLGLAILGCFCCHSSSHSGALLSQYILCSQLLGGLEWPSGCFLHFSALPHPQYTWG